jgi:hypothetical protein
LGFPSSPRAWQTSFTIEAHLNKPLAGRPDAAILEMKYLGDNIFYGG